MKFTEKQNGKNDKGHENYEYTVVGIIQKTGTCHEDINMVMFPNYADKEKQWEFTEEMKQQGIYEESSGQWFFKITDEQFKELEKTYVEAYYLGMKRRYYSYEKLFGEFETE